ncbi:MAG TPA: hypothetical protein VK611_03685 [Acidimicrobiales bacterium]|nr:hypothetical protein [Acidimicrobiales bacterium]
MTDASPQPVRRARWRLMAMALMVPTLGSSLGIDGGDLFQILAVENLGLDARTIGIGLGFCTLSVPVQLWAARLTLGRARQRLVAFLVGDAVLCWILALLVATATPGSGLATSALAVAVVAEIHLSVLYVTAWQPLLSQVLGAADRQRNNAQGRAVARVLMAGLLLVFGLADETTRIVILVAIGGIALVLAKVVGGMPTPDPPVAVVDEPAEPAAAPPGRRWSLPTGMWALCITAGLGAVSAWPLFVTYTHDVLWPDVNLGLMTAAQVGGQVTAGLLWRPTATGLMRRGRRAAVVSVVAATALAAIRAPVEGLTEGMLTLVTVAGAAAALTLVFLVVMELVHQTVDNDTSVRSMTIFDVVASTSGQTGLFVAGFLISASVDSAWPVDPYRVYLLTAATLVAAAVLRLGRRRPALTTSG